MSDTQSLWSAFTFGIALIATFFFAWKGRADSSASAERHLADQRLNRWLVGLSAGATANSGFVVTGAVGLGYAFGLYWLLLPLGWLLGDLVFWRFFPHRLNALGSLARASTLTQILCFGLSGTRPRLLSSLATLIVIVGLGGYTMAQWVAGQKFLEGAYGVTGTTSLVLFGAFIVAYSSIGGFRGSVYADSFQAITRIVGTGIGLCTVLWLIQRDPTVFVHNIDAAGEGFLSLLGTSAPVPAIGFVLGYAAASLGFGLGQPQVTTRYLAADGEREVRGAKWIYIGYVQLTWATMTVIGVLLRGVMPSLDDPEQGFVVLIASTLPAIVVGLVVADIFGAIASTANSLIIAMSQAAREALGREDADSLWVYCAVLGGVTMAGALALSGHTTVFSLAITSVSLMASGLAPAVATKVCSWRHTSSSLVAAIVFGTVSATAWNLAGLSGAINEAAIGIPIGLLANWVAVRLLPQQSPQRSSSDVPPGAKKEH